MTPQTGQEGLRATQSHEHGADVLRRARAAMEQPLSPAGLRLMRFRSLVPELIAEVERLRIENTALREMVEADEIQIHGEWGVGCRDSYDWEPELAQRVCELTTGHPDCEFKEIRHYTTGEFIGFHRICKACGAITRWADADELARLRAGVS